MKKIKLFALAAFAMLSTNALAQDLADGYLRYSVSAGKATITGFVANQEVAAVAIPAQVTDPVTPTTKYDVIGIAAEAFKGKTIIESVTIADTNVKTIGAGAFAGCTKLTTVTIGKAVTTIYNEVSAAKEAVNYTDETAAAYNASLTGAVATGAAAPADYNDKVGAAPADADKLTAAEAEAYNAKLEGAKKAGDEMTPAVPAVLEGAFEGCTALTTVTFNPASGEQTVEAGTFKKTAITSLDLTSAKVAVLYPLFETVGAQVAEIKLSANLETIAANAFEGLTKLTTIDFTVCNANPTNPGVTINANAFLNAMKITKFTVPGVVKKIENGAFAGSYITELTLDATDAAAAHKLTVGTDASIGATKITTLTVNGANLVINTGAFIDAPLATVTFNNDLAANTVATGAFADQDGAATDYKLAVSYTPTGATPAADAFAQNAFAAAADAATYVTFSTSETYGKALNTAIAWATGDGAWGVTLSYTAILPEIPVYKNGGTYAYGGFIAPASGITIAKKQGENNDINVMVYGAYFDKVGTVAKTSAIIMEQMHLDGGNYYLPAGTRFIVKSSSEEPVQYSVGNGGKDSRNYNKAGDPQNMIQAYEGDADCYANSLFVANKTIYFLRDLAGGKEFGWKQRSDDSVIKKGQLYLIFDGAAAARIDLIWADGSEEDATAIQTVKKANAEKGAIYNLAGQKVNAAYKGVVIKDGKKYIQK